MSRCTTGINDAGGKFATGTTGVNDTGGNFAANVNGTGGKFATGGKKWEQYQTVHLIVNLKKKCIYMLTLLLKDL
jgi:hypothetical protein